MNLTLRLVLVSVVAAGAATFIVFKEKNRSVTNGATSSAGASPAATPAITAPGAAKKPRLLELGSDQCVPCKAMMPVLEELRKNHSANLRVEFIDVWKDEKAGEDYKVEIIPTQIFFDADGQELFRHTGFFSKDEILGKWKELGINVP